MALGDQVPSPSLARHKTLMLHPAVRPSAHRALAARERLLQDYPLWEEWRAQARSIKAETLARLDELLERLKHAVEGWGGTVLCARDAAQARELILKVAQRHGVTRVVKAKSMTTEEIGLNPSLTAAGLEVLETDLGEFIIQAAGHPPAHITAPAMHLDRQQIAALLREYLGQDCPAEPVALARRATRFLAPRFREAQMGITGVNFAAAEGTLIFLENEGNLALTATSPPVHLALMGVEKIIPGLADAEALLRLLPVSATGQRATALVHFLRGLKVRPQGRQDFYLVILDNGRRRLGEAPELREALHCLRCGACLNICPVFQAGGAHLYGRVYPGAIGILLAPYLAPVGDLAELCTQCGACQEVCPVRIRLTEKIIQVRRRSPGYEPWRTLTRIAALGLLRPRLYRGLEPGLRLLPRLLPGRVRARLRGRALAPESFHRRQLASGGDRKAGTGAPESGPPRFPRADQGVVEHEDRASSRVRAGLLETRLQEAGSHFCQVRGPEALARHLAGEPPGPLWLEDHPWLREVAVELEKIGRTPRFVGGGEAPAEGTVVTVALGAIPETGSVMVTGGNGAVPGPVPRAGKLVALLPPGRAGLSLSQALELSGQGSRPLVSWLTGPTRTADIEKILVLGAQGPENLEVVLYHEEP
jgi:L-lactate dehydrogenase complex protein LldF